MRAIARNTFGSPDVARRRLGQLKPKREREVTMFISDPRDALVVAHARGRQLRAEAAAERLRGISGTRRAIAVSLRREADRLDSAALARRPALIPETPVKER